MSCPSYWWGLGKPKPAASRLSGGNLVTFASIVCPLSLQYSISIFAYFSSISAKQPGLSYYIKFGSYYVIVQI